MSEPEASGPLTMAGPRFASLAPLRHRDYFLIWIAALVSSLGTWMQTVAVGVLIADLTGQAGWTGLVGAAAFLPIGLLSPVGGAMADRVDRRRWLVATTVGEVVFALTLAVLTGTGHINAPVLTLLVLGGGCMAALGLPAFQAILPDLVPREQLLAASSLGLMQYNLGRVVGPALAGVVLAVGSYTWAFAINAVSFLTVLAAVVAVRLPAPTPTDEAGGLWTRIRTGARAAMAEPGCRVAIVSISVIAFLLSPFIALVPAVALKLFDNAKTGTSVLITGQGIGAVAGALMLASLAARYGQRRVLVVDAVLLPVLLLLYAAAPNLPAAAVAIALVGASYVGVLSGLGTVVQLRAPAALRARALSLYMVALGVIYPVGAVVQGFIGDRIGLRAMTASTAALFLALVLVLRAVRPRLADDLDAPVDETTVIPAPPEVAAGLRGPNAV
ncbi:MAG: MFS transporter, partial [Acidimicrobiales bacterium]